MAQLPVFKSEVIDVHPRMEISVTRNGVKAVARIWRKGDTLVCRQCEHCSADHREGVCLTASSCPFA